VKRGRIFAEGCRQRLRQREVRKSLAASDILSDIEPPQAATAGKQKKAYEKAVLA
jgi:hypothetical protein